MLTILTAIYLWLTSESLEYGEIIAMVLIGLATDLAMGGYWLGTAAVLIAAGFTLASASWHNKVKEWFSLIGCALEVAGTVIALAIGFSHLF